MNNKPTVYTDPYASYLNDARNQFVDFQRQLSAPGRLSYAGSDRGITQGILERVDAYAHLQGEIKKTLNKKVGIDAADFFTETVLSYIQAAFTSAGVRNVEVCSEKKLSPTKNGLRPDISFWTKGKCFAVVECKTQMGWSRLTWERDFHKREASINAETSGVYVAHVVLTSLNWPGFPPNHPNTGCKWITLSPNWPGGTGKMQILHPIEPLLAHIAGLAGAAR